MICSSCGNYSTTRIISIVCWVNYTDSRDTLRTCTMLSSIHTTPRPRWRIKYLQKPTRKTISYILPNICNTLYHLLFKVCKLSYSAFFDAGGKSKTHFDNWSKRHWINGWFAMKTSLFKLYNCSAFTLMFTSSYKYSLECRHSRRIYNCIC